MKSSVPDSSRIFIDHYAVLGLSIKATPDAIQKQFRLLAKKYHPDILGGNDCKFLELYNAYQILKTDESRNNYNVEYVNFLRSIATLNSNRLKENITTYEGRIKSGGDTIVIPTTRLIFPGNIALLAKKGLLKKRFRNQDRKFLGGYNYDIELPLESDEFNKTLIIQIPVIARTLCPNCLGSNTHCHDCNGRGSYKNMRIVQLYLNKRRKPGQIIEILLKNLRLESMSYFKRKKMKIKISYHAAKI